ncbi:hypothetical protein CBW65_06910 [Tumebacillus avium]|uniref:HTH tetR-type domain-containing protein n=1 Tax=Tumebacillus avium TaxID=1903704 RepID=A0A1Y0IMV2_9BACL|nr:TetR/AcrR family transcriptional regulator [Tumebacillus avium]ARU60855.1 hypothetical protein CBW65_06910 [Tumebacillus avium]
MLRSSRKQALKDTIYTKAMQLFVEKGFDRVTVDEITLACGVAKGTFYNYFPKKEAVLLHMGESQMAHLQEQLAELRSLPVIRHRIEKLFAALSERYAAHPELLRVSLSEMVKSAQLLGVELAVIRRFEQALTPLLEEAQQLGQMNSGHSTELAAEVLVGLYFQTLMRFASGFYSDPEQLKNSLQEQLRLVWQGIGGVEQ